MEGNILKIILSYFTILGIILFFSKNNCKSKFEGEHRKTGSI